MPLPLVILFCACNLFLAACIPFLRRYRVPGLWPWTLIASVLLTYSVIAGNAQILSVSGALDRLPPSFEWPIQRASFADLDDGTHVVTHPPTSRIQLYDRDWHYLRGWRVHSGGGDFWALKSPADQIQVFIERGDSRDTFDRDGTLLESGPHPRGKAVADAAPVEQVTFRRAPWLWPFSSPGLSWMLFVLGMVVFVASVSREARKYQPPELQQP